MSLSLGRTLAVVVVSLTLATPWCAAAARTSPKPAQGGRPIAFTLPDLARHLWGWVSDRWTKVGCSLDPGGLPLCDSLSTPDSRIYLENGDAGCTIDPGGILCSWL
jgi:hypothetical protein